MSRQSDVEHLIDQLAAKVAQELQRCVAAKLRKLLSVRATPKPVRRRPYKKTKAHILKKCLQCGRDFRAKRQHTRFCSKSCIGAAYHKKPVVLISGDPLRVASQGAK